MSRNKLERFQCIFCREHTCEILFEQDNEEVSISTLVLDALLLVSFSVVKMTVVEQCYVTV